MSLNLALDFHIAAEKYRDQTAVIYNGLEITYAELANSVRYWTVLLSRLGISRGDTVCMVMPNIPEFTIAYFAILHLGAVVVPCNTLLTSCELAYQFAHADSRYVLTCPSCMAACVEAMRQVDSCTGVIVLGSKEAGLSSLPENCRLDGIFWVEDEIALLKERFPFSMETLTVTARHEHAAHWLSTTDDGSYDDLSASPWPTGVPQEDALCQSIDSTIPIGTRPQSNEFTMGVLPGTPENIPSEDTSFPGHLRHNSEFYTAWESVPSADGRLLTTWCPALAQTSPSDPAMILYTSGTTGFPKGATLTHFNLYSNAHFVRECMTGYQPGKRTLAILPFFHSFGQTFTQNAALFSGATVVMVPRFDPKRVLQTIVEQRVNVVAGVPTMLIHLARMQAKLGLDVSCVQQFISGGSSLSRAAYNDLHEAFPESVILEGYGLSETSPLATAVTPAMGPHPGSIGKEIAGVQVRIMRPDRTFAKPREIGEIVIRGHNVMKGYHKNQLATEKVFVNSWFLSGDLGYCDDEGFFYLVDRIKDIIIRAGMNIYPREIEEVLQTYPAVQMAAVVGVPHPVHGEDVIAFVTLNDGFRNVDELVLSKYCRTRLAAYKCPQKIMIQEELPKGPTGKILKRVLREQYLKNPESPQDSNEFENFENPENSSN